MNWGWNIEFLMKWNANTVSIWIPLLIYNGFQRNRQASKDYIVWTMNGPVDKWMKQMPHSVVTQKWIFFFQLFPKNENHDSDHTMKCRLNKKKKKNSLILRGRRTKGKIVSVFKVKWWIQFHCSLCVCVCALENNFIASNI